MIEGEGPEIGPEDIPEGQGEEYRRLFGEPGGDQASPIELAHAEGKLRDTVKGRMAKIHEDWKAAHGHTDKTWEQILALPEMETEEYQHFAPGAVEFDPVWHDGALLGGKHYMLRGINSPIADPDHMDPDLAKQHAEPTREAVIGSRDKSVHLAILRGGRLEEWTVFLLPDTPPIAVNHADVSYIEGEIEPGVAHRIEEQFGPDSVPKLSLPEIKLLTTAVTRTPAHIPIS